MFKCAKCEAMEAEIVFLRETNSKLVDRLVAMANPVAYQAVNPSFSDPAEYYGNETDEIIEYNEFGQKILVKRPQNQS